MHYNLVQSYALHTKHESTLNIIISYLISSYFITFNHTVSIPNRESMFLCKCGSICIFRLNDLDDVKLK